MDFKFTPEQELFRKAVRDFLLRELPHEKPEVRMKGIDGFSPLFSRKVAEKGWIGLAWPKEYGGKNLDQISRTIYTEEMTYHEAPTGAHSMDDQQIGPSLIAYGRENQKREFLPRLIRAELYICLGLSEPDAGSDLASLKTRAMADGDDFIINGQKTWITRANLADYCWVAVRTDPDAPKHKGISEFLVDLKLPGITIRPIPDMSGASSMCDVFFRDVRVPRTALIGQLNKGWQQITSQMAYERSGIDWVMRTRLLFEELVDYVRHKQSYDPGPRWSHYAHRLAELDIEFEVGRLFCYKAASMLSHGRIPRSEPSISKVFGTELGQRVARLGLEILGLDGTVISDPGLKPLEAKAYWAYLFTINNTIMGGTSEIHRDQIALHGLGLPR